MLLADTHEQASRLSVVVGEYGSCRDSQPDVAIPDVTPALHISAQTLNQTEREPPSKTLLPRTRSTRTHGNTAAFIGQWQRLSSAMRPFALSPLQNVICIHDLPALCFQVDRVLRCE